MHNKKYLLKALLHKKEISLILLHNNKAKILDKNTQTSYSVKKGLETWRSFAMKDCMQAVRLVWSLMKVSRYLCFVVM